MRRSTKTLLLLSLLTAALVASVCMVRARWSAWERALYEDKETHFAMDRAPYYVAESALAFIKRTGRVPRMLEECMCVETEPSEQIPGYVLVRLPYDCSHGIYEPVYRCLRLNFVSDPRAYEIRDEVLVSRETGKEVEIISVACGDANRGALRWANAYLWRNWKLLDEGRPTCEEWLDALAPGADAPCASAPDVLPAPAP